MFLLRAMFWIAAVAVFVPQAPDAIGPRNREPAAIENFRIATLAELNRVKAEFAEDDRARKNRDPV